MKLFNSLFASFMGFLLVSCLTMEPSLYSFNLRNKSECNVYTLCRWDTEYTGLYIKENKLDMDSTRYQVTRVEPDYFHPIMETENDYMDYLKSTDTITVFILDEEEYKSKTWSQLVDSAHFRQIYHLSGDDIRRLGSKIPYPPTEIMRDMDIIPKYGEQEETD